MYLILDQFEEYFLYHGEERLLDELPELLRLPRVHVLISLRDDSLSRLDAFQARIPNVFANRLSIDHLDRAAAHAAIVGPIERWNEISSPEVRVGIEAGLVAAVLDEVAAAPAGNGSSAGGLIEAPYLQLVMERVWEEEQAAGSQLLRLSTLERLGGARAIVSAHLERTLGALDAARRGDCGECADLPRDAVTDEDRAVVRRPRRVHRRVACRAADRPRPARRATDPPRGFDRRRRAALRDLPRRPRRAGARRGGGASRVMRRSSASGDGGAA